KNVVWTEQAKAQLRAIDQPTALRILHALACYLETGEGDTRAKKTIELNRCAVGLAQPSVAQLPTPSLQ
ncbi:MAG TPA: hypothetical protein VHM88_25015, partial [Candidatus Acidoferrales bacterium]|nr:hypothetical protein [Candidatus Acidoferrales bacterium]